MVYVLKFIASILINTLHCAQLYFISTIILKRYILGLYKYKRLRIWIIYYRITLQNYRFKKHSVIFKIQSGQYGQYCALTLIVYDTIYYRFELISRLLVYNIIVSPRQMYGLWPHVNKYSFLLPQTIYCVNIWAFKQRMLFCKDIWMVHMYAQPLILGWTILCKEAMDNDKISKPIDPLFVRQLQYFGWVSVYWIYNLSY